MPLRGGWPRCATTGTHARYRRRVLEDPGLDPQAMAAALRAAWAVEASAFTFIPSHDVRTASYEVGTGDARAFLKVHFGRATDAAQRPEPGSALEVPRALLDAGIPNVLAPLSTLRSTLCHPLGADHMLVLYPLVAGANAKVAGMTADQWRTFGETLRAVHDSRVAEEFAGRLPAETFGLATASAVVRALEPAERLPMPSPAAERLGAFLRAQAGRIGTMLDRATEIGLQLRERPFAHVLCHSDIHAANVLVADDGRILLVDWDQPMLAPRERDLLFVIGSRIGRTVEPHEEAWFFEGYGDVPVDSEAIVYYRFERVLEDIGEIAASVFADPTVTEAARASQVAMTERFFDPGGIVETAELV